MEKDEVNGGKGVEIVAVSLPFVLAEGAHAEEQRLTKGELLRRRHDALTPHSHLRRTVGRSPHQTTGTARGTPTALRHPDPAMPSASEFIPSSH